MSKIKRRQFLTTAGRGALGATALSQLSGCRLLGIRGRREWPPRRKPNIIFILADDLGYGDLGCYGQKVIQTPNIDRMAAEGMRFTDAYAGSTVCAPSRCCLMTGYHTGHARVRGNKRHPLLPEDVTVAETLKSAGYATGIIGKWGLGEPDTSGIPNRQGFDEWFGYLNQRVAHNYYPEALWENERHVVLGGRHYSHDLFTERALDFVQRHKDHPFFLYLAYTIPHANNELGRETGNGMQVPSDAPYSDEPWPQPQKNHAAMITRLDRDVGRLLAQVKDLGLDEDTIIFFSSDNGPHKEGGADPEFFDSSGPLRGYKRSLHDGGIRVPTIVRWPGTIRRHRTSRFAWAFWDLLPTAAELAGVEAPAGIDGISIVPSLLGRRQTRDGFLYWEFHERGFQQAVRMDKWKGVRPALNKPLEIYDLRADPGEKNDIAAANPRIVAHLDAIMKSARVDSEHYPLPSGKRS
jgi:arylsulfatase A-like enzyme